MKLKNYKFDIFLGVAVLVIASIFGAFTYLKKSNDLVCLITDCNNAKTTYKLSEENEKERQINVAGIYQYLIVGIDKKGVRVIESNCPHQDCVNEGKISRNGQAIICLYNKVIIELKNSTNKDIYL